MMRGSQQSTTTTVQVAGGVDRSGAVLVLGLGLVVFNALFGTADLLSRLSGGPSTTSAPVAWQPLLLTLLLVFLLLLVAKTGEAGGNFAVLFLAALWVVFLLNKPDIVAKVLGRPVVLPNSTPTH